MGETYDTVLELYARVRRRLERIADDPQFAEPGLALRELDRFMHDEFGMLHEHGRNLTAGALRNVLGSSARVQIYAELLGVRAACLAGGGEPEAAASEARRALELYLEDGVATGTFALDGDRAEHLRRLMGTLALSPPHEEALRSFLGQPYR